MTKEQLIELIQNNVNDGDLINIRISKDEIFEVTGIDDDSAFGLWNLIITPVNTEDTFKSAVQNSIMWKNSGLKSKINWK